MQIIVCDYLGLFLFFLGNIFMKFLYIIKKKLFPFMNFLWSLIVYFRNNQMMDLVLKSQVLGLFNDGFGLKEVLVH